MATESPLYNYIVPNLIVMRDLMVAIGAICYVIQDGSSWRRDNDGEYWGWALVERYDELT